MLPERTTTIGELEADATERPFHSMKAVDRTWSLVRGYFSVDLVQGQAGERVSDKPHGDARKKDTTYECKIEHLCYRSAHIVETV